VGSPPRAAACSAIAASLLLATASARADGVADLEGLLEESVVSSASKAGAEIASTAPATTTTITAEDLRRYGVRSLDEALNFLSLGMITENPRQTVEIGARGVLLSRDYGTHVLLLVDGHMMNEPWNGTAYFDRGAGIPFELIDRIEVILGPGSVLYGSNAMLGVINIVTKRAKDFSGLRGIVESELPISIRGAAGFGKDFKLLGVKGEVTAAIEYYASRGPNSRFGPQNFGADGITGQPARFSSATPANGIWSSDGQPNLFFSQVPAAYARVAIGSFEIALRGSMFKRWNPFTGSTDLAGTNGFELDRWLSLDARWHTTVAAPVRLSARLYGDLYDYHERDPLSRADQCIEGQPNGCIYDLYGKSRWAGLELGAAFDWLKDGRVVTTIGVDGRVRYTEGSTGQYTDRDTGKGPTPAPPYSATEPFFAAFAEQTARPARWLAFNAGGRLDVDKPFGVHFSPRVAAVVSPWSGGHFKAIYSEAFRAPSGFERYYYDPLAAVPSPNLRPEVVRSVEASFEQRLGAQRLLVTGFRSWWKDIVVTEYLSDEELAAAKAKGQLADAATYASRYKNASSVTSFGASLAFDGVAAHRVRYGLGITAAYARQDDGDGSAPHPLAAAAQLFGNARLAYDLGEGLPVIALAGRFAGSRPISGSDFVPTPYASPLAEVRVTASGPFPRLRGLTYRVSWSSVFTEGAPYRVGPNGPSPGYDRQEIIPLDRFRVAAGLEYALAL
jgi:outer membrane receptor protein involved in Fe transport